MEKWSLPLLVLSVVVAISFMPASAGQVSPVVGEPAPVSAVLDDPGRLIALEGASDVEVYATGNHTYAVVAAWGDDGVQIINVTDPTQPAPVSAVSDGSGKFNTLNSATDVEVFSIGGRTYGIVTASGDDGVQIINITDPTHPTYVSDVSDGSGGFDALSGAADVEVFVMGDRTYGIVTNWYGNGLQIMDISDPMQPVPVSSVSDGSDGFDALSWAADVEVFVMGDRTYGIVAAVNDGGLQIMDISDPMQPIPVSSVSDGSDGFEALSGAVDVEVFVMGDRTYGIVAGWYSDGVQIMDITNPARPVPVSATFDGTGGFEALEGAYGVEVFSIPGRTYGIVAARGDDGVQIMDITNPARPVPVSAAFDGSGGFDALSKANDVEVHDIGGRTYGIVTAMHDGGVQIMDITPPLPRYLDVSVQVTGHERPFDDNDRFVQISVAITNHGSTTLSNYNQNGTAQPGELHVSLNALRASYPDVYAASSCDATPGHCVWSNDEYIAYNDMTHKQAEGYGAIVSQGHCTAWNGWSVQRGETENVTFCYWVDAEFEPESMQFYQPDAYLVQSIPFLESGSCYLPYMLCNESALMPIP